MERLLVNQPTNEQKMKKCNLFVEHKVEAEVSKVTIFSPLRGVIIPVLTTSQDYEAEIR